MPSGIPGCAWGWGGHGFPQIKAGWGLRVRPSNAVTLRMGELRLALLPGLGMGEWSGALDTAWPPEASQSRVSSWSSVRQRQSMEKCIEVKGAARAGTPSSFRAWSVGSRRAAHPGKSQAAPKASLQKGAQRPEVMAQVHGCACGLSSRDQLAGTLLPPTGCIHLVGLFHPTTPTKVGLGLLEGGVRGH